MSHSHTVVIGGGVIGASAAYYLAKRGQKVTLLEHNELASGSSSGNAGQITPGHLPLPQPGTMARNLRWLFKRTSPLYVKPRLDFRLLRWLWQFTRACNAEHLNKTTRILCQLGTAAFDLFDQLADELDFGFHRKGRLEVCRSEKSLLAVEREAQMLKTFGFDGQLLRGAEVHDCEPAVTGEVAGGVYYPDSGDCDPHQLVLQLAEAAADMGATVRENTPVTDVRLDGQRATAVVTDREEIEVDSVVLATGAWIGPLQRRFALRIAVQPGKGYHLDIERPAACPAMPIVFVEEKIFLNPIDDFLRLAGTMELSGFNLRQIPLRLEMLSIGAARYLDGVEQAPVRSKWCHLRPMTPDGLPIIGPTPGAENAFVATGHGMLGVTQGPITGKLLADLVTDGATDIDLSELRPNRF